VTVQIRKRHDDVRKHWEKLERDYVEQSGNRASLIDRLVQLARLLLCMKIAREAHDLIVRGSLYRSLSFPKNHELGAPGGSEVRKHRRKYGLTAPLGSRVSA